MTTPSRRPTRLPAFDYTDPGAYFITLVAHHRARLFGGVVDGVMRLNGWGEIVREEWEKTPQIRPEVELGVYQIMPNHFHAILIIHDVGAHGRAPDQNLQPPPGRVTQPGHPAPGLPSAIDNPATMQAHSRAPLQRPPRSLGSCVAGFKSAVTTRINQIRRTPGQLVWQRNYYEHILRGERDWDAIAAYILTNPNHWDLDNENDCPRRHHAA